MMASSTQFQLLALVKEAVSRLETRMFKKEDEAKRRFFIPAQVLNVNKVNQTVRGDIEWPTF